MDWLGWLFAREIVPPSLAGGSGLPSVAVTSIADGWRGTEQTIAAMGLLAAEGGADPAVRLAAERIIGNDLPARAYDLECARLLNYVRKHCRYTLDPRGVEQIKKPRYLLFEDPTRLSDCDDQAALFAALCLSLGHEAGFRAVKADPRRPRDYSHVYALVRPGMRSAWLPADPIEPKCRLGEPPELFHKCWGQQNWTIHPGNGQIIRDNSPVAGVSGCPASPIGGACAAGGQPRFVVSGSRPAMFATPFNPVSRQPGYIL